MNNFSISQLSEFSGVKQHTIRMWEQRYNALQPSRSDGNTRRYDGVQLRRLLNLVSLTEMDYKISELGSLPDEKLFGLLTKAQLEELPVPTDYFVSQLTAAGIEYDERAFDKIFSHCVLRFGLKETYKMVINPMLARMGLMWRTNHLPPANEHFISNLVRQKLYTSIDSLPPSTQDPLSWVLFLPENEFHDIGLLMTNYLLRVFGKNTVYLGANVPQSSITKAVEDVNPENLLLFLTHKVLPESIESYLLDLTIKTKKRIYVAGGKDLLENIKINKKVVKVSSIQELEAHL